MPTRRLAALSAAFVSALFLWNCGASSPSAPSGGGGSTPDPPVTLYRIVAAGDIGECGFGAMQTGALLDGLSGTLLALGDLAYMQGTSANFRDCYNPAWGRHIDRTRPAPGNHEYETAGASSYFDYFGSLAGTRGLGYYAFPAGPWRIIALNSEISIAPGSPQQQWLRSELIDNRRDCVLAYWHRPLFTSGPNGPQTDIRELWRTLLDFNVDVVLNGHDHLYERFAPQDLDGRPSATGIRQFIAGTGGAHLYPFVGAKPNSEKRVSAYGILKMTLTTGTYQWEFEGVDKAILDSGTGTCH